MTYSKEAIKRFKYRLMIGIIVLFVLNFICFFVAWIIGVNNSNNKYFEVLSYFLANDPTARAVYLAWFISYVILNIPLIYTMVKNDLTTTDNSQDDVAHKAIHCSFDTKNRLYRFCTLIAIPVDFLRLFAFFLLYNFDMTNYANEHYIWTGIALIGSTVWCSLLFIRRLCARVYIHIHDWIYLVYFINASTIILQIVFVSLLPAAPDSMRGIFELMMAIFIGVDPIYQISDVYCDYKCNTTIDQHYKKHSCHKRLLEKYTQRREGRVSDMTQLESVGVEVIERVVGRGSM